MVLLECFEVKKVTFIFLSKNFNNEPQIRSTIIQSSTAVHHPVL